MQLTLDALFNDANIVKAVIDRVQQTKLDTIYWKRYLDFEETKSRYFKAYVGSITGVRAGSIIDRNSKKPIRERRGVGTAIGETACLGDKYQLDNDRLDNLRSLINKFNGAKTSDQSMALNDLVGYITDDYRQVLLAPHKQMDIIMGALRSTGTASVKNATNPYGVELIDITLPVISYTPEAGDKTNFITYLKGKISALKATAGLFGVMEMTEATFTKYILGSAEFASTFKMIMASSEIALAGGLITVDMANVVLKGVGLPPIRLVDEYVVNAAGDTVSTFAEKRITLLQTDKIGKMMWYEPYEISDPVPGKTYTRSEGGMFISQVRTEEGRFMEYGAEWVPNIAAPNKMVNFNLVNF